MKHFIYFLLYSFRSILDLFFSIDEHGVLAYHSISDDPNENSIDAKKFRSHLFLLKKAGYSFVSLDDVVDWYLNKKELPKKTVAVTFDDGYKDFITTALPILQEFGCPSTVFIIEREYKTQIELLDNKDIDRLQNTNGVVVGFHTKTHPDLRELSEDGVKDECISSVRPYRFFAYPGGNYSDIAISTVRQRYEAAFSIKPELVTRKSNLHVLPRIVVTKKISDKMLLIVVSLASTWYRTIRRTVLYVAGKN